MAAILLRVCFAYKFTPPHKFPEFLLIKVSGNILNIYTATPFYIFLFRECQILRVLTL